MDGGVRNRRTIDCERLLRDAGLLPMSLWNSFEFEHRRPTDSADGDALLTLLAEEVGRKRDGVYVYNREGHYLYVGKGRPIFSRLKSHLRESYEEVPGDTKDNRWHRFFSQHSGRVRVYWMEVEDEMDRRVIELVLTKLLSPTFECFR
jgi:hypothetical protein